MHNKYLEVTRRAFSSKSNSRAEAICFQLALENPWPEGIGFSIFSKSVNSFGTGPSDRSRALKKLQFGICLVSGYAFYKKFELPKEKT